MTLRDGGPFGRVSLSIVSFLLSVLHNDLLLTTFFLLGTFNTGEQSRLRYMYSRYPDLRRRWFRPKGPP